MPAFRPSTELHVEHRPGLGVLGFGGFGSGGEWVEEVFGEGFGDLGVGGVWGLGFVVEVFGDKNRKTKMKKKKTGNSICSTLVNFDFGRIRFWPMSKLAEVEHPR